MAKSERKRSTTYYQTSGVEHGFKKNGSGESSEGQQLYPRDDQQGKASRWLRVGKVGKIFRRFTRQKKEMSYG